MSYVTGISGNVIFAASAGYAPTIGADVSAIASAYVESGVSSKQDTLTFGYDDDKISAINGSALAGGGGATGDYVEKSATEVAIGSANVASSASFAQGIDNTASSNSFAQGSGNSAILSAFAQGIGNTSKSYALAQGKYNSADSAAIAQGSSNKAYQVALSLGIKNTALYNSIALGTGNSANSDSFALGRDNKANGIAFTQGRANTARYTSFAQGYYNSATQNAAVFGQYNLRGDGDTSTGNSAAFAIGDGTSTVARHDLMLVTKDGEITMYSSTADTTGTGIMSSIRALSANAGGVDSATVSAIASSYAESAVSSKADSSTLSSYVPYSSLEYNTASAISGINGSALAAGSTYSAGEGIDITDDVISVEAPVDIVAGPGIVIDNPDGNTLRVSTDENYETVLWEGTLNTLNSDVSCSESIYSFDRIKVFYRIVADSTLQSVAVHEFEPSEISSTSFVSFGSFYLISNGWYGWWLCRLSVTDNNKIKITKTLNSYGNGPSPAGISVDSTDVGFIYKVVGIHRIANN